MAPLIIIHIINCGFKCRLNFDVILMSGDNIQEACTPSLEEGFTLLYPDNYGTTLMRYIPTAAAKSVAPGIFSARFIKLRKAQPYSE